ncbi:unnamed protein product (macronuclear) [Paramecium tetraurelia]|uniref:Uncharacterized protein n=1 Tax=Paramecium tetraurelia TaxID=5888 RepID=A0DVF5_PARTE|nr:uncharacterized protein GSPATT00039786001 [Paramecium tetraurelia]CAK87022.1 unnamed protein product [Paramecium tetraurelia]|eukprot:XP_001454419.1 hypothetical protein (macronuclear) [Paramecium tetraurelia strain d4-2]
MEISLEWSREVGEFLIRWEQESNSIQIRQYLAN